MQIMTKKNVVRSPRIHRRDQFKIKNLESKTHD